MTAPDDEYILYGIDIDDIDEYDPDSDTVVKRCNCGYEGPLDPAVDGYECPACGYLLISRME